MLSKVEKIILYSIFGSVPAGLVLFFLYCVIFGPSTREVIIERDLSENVNGVVDTLYNDERNHDIRTAILKDNGTFEILREWESEIEVGDSLYKKKDHFF